MKALTMETLLSVPDDEDGDFLIQDALTDALGKPDCFLNDAITADIASLLGVPSQSLTVLFHDAAVRSRYAALLAAARPKQPGPSGIGKEEETEEREKERAESSFHQIQRSLPAAWVTHCVLDLSTLFPCPPTEEQRGLQRAKGESVEEVVNRMAARVRWLSLKETPTDCPLTSETMGVTVRCVRSLSLSSGRKQPDERFRAPTLTPVRVLGLPEETWGGRRSDSLQSSPPSVPAPPPVPSPDPGRRRTQEAGQPRVSASTSQPALPKDRSLSAPLPVVSEETAETFTQAEDQSAPRLCDLLADLTSLEEHVAAFDQREREWQWRLGERGTRGEDTRQQQAHEEVEGREVLEQFDGRGAEMALAKEGSSSLQERRETGPSGTLGEASPEGKLFQPREESDPLCALQNFSATPGGPSSAVKGPSVSTGKAEEEGKGEVESDFLVIGVKEGREKEEDSIIGRKGRGGKKEDPAGRTSVRAPLSPALPPSVLSMIPRPGSSNLPTLKACCLMVTGQMQAVREELIRKEEDWNREREKGREEETADDMDSVILEELLPDTSKWGREHSVPGLSPCFSPSFSHTHHCTSASVEEFEQLSTSPLFSHPCGCTCDHSLVSPSKGPLRAFPPTLIYPGPLPIPRVLPPEPPEEQTPKLNRCPQCHPTRPTQQRLRAGSVQKVHHGNSLAPPPRPPSATPSLSSPLESFTCSPPPPITQQSPLQPAFPYHLPGTIRHSTSPPQVSSNISQAPSLLSGQQQTSTVPQTRIDSALLIPPPSPAQPVGVTSPSTAVSIGTQTETDAAKQRTSSSASVHLLVDAGSGPAPLSEDSLSGDFSNSKFQSPSLVPMPPHMIPSPSLPPMQPTHPVPRALSSDPLAASWEVGTHLPQGSHPVFAALDEWLREWRDNNTESRNMRSRADPPKGAPQGDREVPPQGEWGTGTLGEIAGGASESQTAQKRGEARGGSEEGVAVSGIRQETDPPREEGGDSDEQTELTGNPPASRPLSLLSFKEDAPGGCEKIHESGKSGKGTLLDNQSVPEHPNGLNAAVPSGLDGMQGANAQRCERQFVSHQDWAISANATSSALPERQREQVASSGLQGAPHPRAEASGTPGQVLVLPIHAVSVSVGGLGESGEAVASLSVPPTGEGQTVEEGTRGESETGQPAGGGGELISDVAPEGVRESRRVSLPPLTEPECERTPATRDRKTGAEEGDQPTMAESISPPTRGEDSLQPCPSSPPTAGETSESAPVCDSRIPPDSKPTHGGGAEKSMGGSEFHSFVSGGPAGERRPEDIGEGAVGGEGGGKATKGMGDKVSAPQWPLVTEVAVAAPPVPLADSLRSVVRGPAQPAQGMQNAAFRNLQREFSAASAGADLRVISEPQQQTDREWTQPSGTPPSSLSTQQLLFDHLAAEGGGGNDRPGEKEGSGTPRRQAGSESIGTFPLLSVALSFPPISLPALFHQERIRRAWSSGAGGSSDSPPHSSQTFQRDPRGQGAVCRFSSVPVVLFYREHLEADGGWMRAFESGSCFQDLGVLAIEGHALPSGGRASTVLMSLHSHLVSTIPLSVTAARGGHRGSSEGPSLEVASWGLWEGGVEALPDEGEARFCLGKKVACAMRLERMEGPSAVTKRGEEGKHQPHPVLVRRFKACMSLEGRWERGEPSETGKGSDSWLFNGSREARDALDSFALQLQRDGTPQTLEGDTQTGPAVPSRCLFVVLQQEQERGRRSKTSPQYRIVGGVPVGGSPRIGRQQRESSYYPPVNYQLQAAPDGRHQPQAALSPSAVLPSFPSKFPERSHQSPESPQEDRQALHAQPVSVSVSPPHQPNNPSPLPMQRAPPPQHLYDPRHHQLLPPVQVYHTPAAPPQPSRTNSAAQPQVLLPISPPSPESPHANAPHGALAQAPPSPWSPLQHGIVVAPSSPTPPQPAAVLHGPYFGHPQMHVHPRSLHTQAAEDDDEAASDQTARCLCSATDRSQRSGNAIGHPQRPERESGKGERDTGFRLLSMVGRCKDFFGCAEQETK
uniref:Uncharacterized protein n=1 Tax=Chromera velia CCMP2878 TaxID=1169474 RepID=A0A0G4IG34_9ALVE|eukprot:Cvel_14097.t1-p1 / transcript=Cvel_14097.t1 / gene=Cvel_14097 / organism=Chromera_velia_CCMP2878 / gene_product=hypothetical protein / transcript_product=hypothetical protein / location=Cvel_scaffold991:112-6372(-) / protein_length=2008 / sequence_SO=supercontig / SO=protein_coding / is_pseudo=false